MLSSKIDSMKNDIVAAIQGCLRIPSVGGDPVEGAPYGAGPRRSLDWTLAFAEKMGFRTKNVDNVAGWAEMGEGPEMVAVLGHLDVVPEGDGWSVDPWGGELKDGMLYGRGVIDNKGPVMIALFAAKAVFDSGMKLKRRVRVIFGTNEERGSKCMKRYVEAGEELPVAGFTPDAEYPIINAEKGILTYTLSMPFTPSGGMRVLSLSGGVASNVVMAEVRAEVAIPDPECGRRIADAATAWKGPEGGSVKVDWDGSGDRVTVVAKGRPAHGSTPEKGVNALACLSDFMSGLRLRDEQGDFFRAFSRLVGFETDGRSLGIAMGDEVSPDCLRRSGGAQCREGALYAQHQVPRDSVGGCRDRASAQGPCRGGSVRRRRRVGRSAVRPARVQAREGPAEGLLGRHRRGGGAPRHRGRHLREVDAERGGLRPRLPRPVVQGSRGGRALGGRRHHEERPYYGEGNSRAGGGVDDRERTTKKKEFSSPWPGG